MHELSICMHELRLRTQVDIRVHMGTDREVFFDIFQPPFDQNLP